MSLTVDWTNRGSKEFERLPKESQQRISEAIEEFTTTGRGDFTKIEGTNDEYRLRVGDWRVRFRWKKREKTIVIRHVRQRGSAYQP